MTKRAFHPVVVLVRSLYDSNIGASSRAMANMGVRDLILIGPQCEITYAAQQAAATGQTALQTRRTYANWDEFFAAEPDGLRLAFTARDGKGRLVEDCATTLREIAEHDSQWQKAGPALPLYLIFGPEDCGLSAADLELTHRSVSIPTFGDNPSLNLAQAVLLGLFILRNEWGGEAFSYEERGSETQFQNREDLFPEKSLAQFLTAMGFSLENRRTNVYTVLRRLFLRTVPTEKERRVLEIVFQQGARKLREKAPHPKE
jgi:tRNA/rRNA methyltransferase